MAERTITSASPICRAQVGKQLGLSARQCEPMAVPFERYGNTSSSSTWYGAFASGHTPDPDALPCPNMPSLPGPGGKALC